MAVTPPAAFMSGQGRGRLLELQGCVLDIPESFLWADSDRPQSFVWGEGNSLIWDSSASNEPRDDLGPHLDVVQGLSSESSDSDSLQSESFADMERLMAELDEMALRGDQ